jgi:hypothetical protein
MSPTYEQSLAFIDACLSSPKVKSHLGAVLGHKGVPVMKDFEGHDPDAVERCVELVIYLTDVGQIVERVQRVRPRQGTLPLEDETGNRVGSVTLTHASIETIKENLPTELKKPATPKRSHKAKGGKVSKPKKASPKKPAAKGKAKKTKAKAEPRIHTSAVEATITPAPSLVETA